MKKTAALALAGLMGVSTLAMTAGSAAAHPPGPPPPWMNHHHHHGGPGWWGWGGPFLLGLGVGTLYSNSYAYGGDWDDHVRWCEAHYRSYNPRTDTFYIRAGVPARCVAPFDRW